MLQQQRDSVKNMMVMLQERIDRFVIIGCRFPSFRFSMVHTASFLIYGSRSSFSKSDTQLIEINRKTDKAN